MAYVYEVLLVLVLRVVHRHIQHLKVLEYILDLFGWFIIVMFRLRFGDLSVFLGVDMGAEIFEVEEEAFARGTPVG